MHDTCDGFSFTDIYYPLEFIANTCSHFATVAFLQMIIAFIFLVENMRRFWICKKHKRDEDIIA